MNREKVINIPCYYAVINGKKVYDTDSIREEFDYDMSELKRK